MRKFKTWLCKFVLVLDVVLCAMLFSAVVESELSFLIALPIAGASICFSDLFCRVMLPAPAAKSAPTVSPIVLHVIHGGKAA
jgi:hypothetical protein